MANVVRVDYSLPTSGQSGREILRLEDDAALVAYMDAAGVGGAVAWDDVTDKPTEFPPIDHQHDWGEITSGVPTEFTPSSHSHDWTEIATGLPTTLSGYGITDAIHNYIGSYGGVTLSDELTGYNFVHQSIDATGVYDETLEIDVYRPTASIVCSNVGDGSGGINLTHDTGSLRVYAVGDSGNGTTTYISLSAANYAVANQSVFRTAIGLGTMATEASTSYLALAGGTMTGRVNFSGASALLVLGTLTTAQRTAYGTKTNGDLFYESTVGRYGGRIGGADVQLLDSTGGQTITCSSAATVGATVKLASSQTANAFEVRNSASTLMSSFDKDGSLTLDIQTGGLYSFFSKRAGVTKFSIIADSGECTSQGLFQTQVGFRVGMREISGCRWLLNAVVW